MSTERLPRCYLVYHLQVYKGVLAWVQAEDARTHSAGEAKAIAEATGPTNSAKVFESRGNDTVSLLEAQRAFGSIPFLTRVRA